MLTVISNYGIRAHVPLYNVLLGCLACNEIKYPTSYLQCYL